MFEGKNWCKVPMIADVPLSNSWCHTLIAKDRPLHCSVYDYGDVFEWAVFYKINSQFCISGVGNDSVSTLESAKAKAIEMAEELVKKLSWG